MNRIIISDTSCLIALSKIGRLDILQKLYSKISITDTVKAEFGSELPDWIVVEKVKDKVQYEAICQKLDPGEASSITLALENPGCLLVIDEKKGRHIAREFNIQIIGTLKIILMAKEKNIIQSVRQIIIELTENNFRVEKKLINELLKASNEL